MTGVKQEQAIWGHNTANVMVVVEINFNFNAPLQRRENSFE